MVEKLEKQDIDNQGVPYDDGDSQSLSHYETVGSHLKSLRETAGYSIEETSTNTKIKPVYLDAIENADYASLPATPYAVGFVKIYATYLGQDPDTLAAQFRQEMTSPDAALNQPSVTPHPARDLVKTKPVHSQVKNNAEMPNATTNDQSPSGLAILSIIILIIFAIWTLMSLMRSDPSPNEAIAASPIVQNEVKEPQSSSVSAPEIDIVAPTKLPQPETLFTDNQNASTQVTEAPDILAADNTANQTSETAVTTEVPEDVIPEKTIVEDTLPTEVFVSEVTSSQPELTTTDTVVENAISAPVQSAQGEATQTQNETENLAPSEPTASAPQGIKVIRGPNNNENITSGNTAGIHEIEKNTTPRVKPSTTNTDNNTVPAEIITKVEDVPSNTPLENKASAPVDGALNTPAPTVDNEPNLPNLAKKMETAVLLSRPEDGSENPDTALDQAPIIQQATIARQAPLTYPNRCASKANGTNTVKVGFDLTDRGEVINQRVINSSKSCFERAALNNIKKWRYNPKLSDGRPVSSENLSVTMQFLIH